MDTTFTDRFINTHHRRHCPKCNNVRRADFMREPRGRGYMTVCSFCNFVEPHRRRARG